MNSRLGRRVDILVQLLSGDPEDAPAPADRRLVRRAIQKGK